MQHVFASWSGGKDSCLATYYAVDWGLEVRFLLTMMDEAGKQSWVHRLPMGLLKMQAQAMGIPLLAKRSTMPTYEADFKEALTAFKGEGVSGGIFGDIDIAEHRQWVERVCREAGMLAHLPLWKHDQREILKDFIDLGFEAVIVAAQADLLGEEWLGRKIDSDFVPQLDELGRTKKITYCGEVGEYHTVVIGGPLFKKRIEILKTEKVLRDGHWFLEVLDYRLKPK